MPTGDYPFCVMWTPRQRVCRRRSRVARGHGETSRAGDRRLSGIGFELATLFADDGYDLVVAADEDGIDAAADKLRSAGVESKRYRQTCGNPGRGSPLRHRDRRWPHLGRGGSERRRGRAGSFLEGELDDDLGIVDLNVRSTVHLARLVLGDMARRGAARRCSRRRSWRGMPGWYQTCTTRRSRSCSPSRRRCTTRCAVPGDGHGTDAGSDRDQFLRRAGMLDTVIGRMPKDDPAVSRVRATTR